MHLAVDGTGIPMRGEDMEGADGRAEDGSAGIREAKLAVAHSAKGRDPETGAVLKDRGSGTYSCLIDSAASAGPSDFATRPDREVRRRGLHDAEEPAVISGGAEWIRSVCGGLLGGPEGHLRARPAACA